MAVNKVVINNEVKLDLTADTVTPETLLSGVTAHNAAGNLIVGEAEPPVNVQPLSVTANGTYTAPEGVAYSPVSVSVSVEASNFYTGTGTPASTFGSVGDFFFVTG